MAGTTPGGPYEPGPGGVPPQQGGIPPQQGGAYQAPTQHQQPYPQQQYGGGGQSQGPGAGERAQELARSIRTPETKPFFKTSEFLVWALTILAILIAGAVEGGDDGGGGFGATTVWTLITAVSFAYIISRGISKAGTKYGDDDRRRY